MTRPRLRRAKHSTRLPRAVSPVTPSEEHRTLVETALPALGRLLTAWYARGGTVDEVSAIVARHVGVAKAMLPFTDYPQEGYEIEGERIVMLLPHSLLPHFNDTLPFFAELRGAASASRGNDLRMAVFDGETIVGGWLGWDFGCGLVTDLPTEHPTVALLARILYETRYTLRAKALVAMHAQTIPPEDLVMDCLLKSHREAPGMLTHAEWLALERERKNPAFGYRTLRRQDLAKELTLPNLLESLAQPALPGCVAVTLHGFGASIYANLTLLEGDLADAPPTDPHDVC